VSFGSISIIERFLKLEESQRLIERRLSIAERDLNCVRDGNVRFERELNRLSSGLSKAESAILSQSREFEGERLYRRGCEYFFGTNGFGERGEELSQTLGVSQLKKSADLGHTDAQYRIGYCLIWGKGCRSDLKEGVRYLRQSVDGGNSFAECRFGRCLQGGSGVAKDEVLGFEFIKRSAAAGNALGQQVLGICLANGRGTAKDLGGAIESYKQSMEQGNSWGNAATAQIWWKGRGLQQIQRPVFPL
jgi:TPR repeat protein